MEDNEAMLCAYIEGDLDAAGRAQIEKLLQDNPQHRKLLAELTAMRDLVRGLPRVKAPMDLGDSLRQRAERSMLLDGPGAVVPQRERMSRWPQFFAIAAIFLLFASLCFILYKALGPTLKPAAFTQNMADNKFLNTEPTSVVSAPAAPPGAAPSELAAVLPATAHPIEAKMQPAEAKMQQAEGKMQQAEPMMQNVQNLSVQSRRQVVMARQLDLGAIRRRLESSGYGVEANGGPIGGGNFAPVLMVVNSTDAPATKVQIAQFLNNSTGISWSVIPQDAQWQSKATTLPSDGALGGGAAEDQLKAPLYDASGNGAAEASSATTQPSSSDVFYVARGLTAEQADALRQTLIVPQNGPEVQVTMQSAQPLATTEPSVMTDKDVSTLSLGQNTYSAASQPSDVVSNLGAYGVAARPTTMPAAAPSRHALAPAAGMPVNRPQALQSVDAVIVLEQSGTSVLTAGPSTRADSAAAKSEPAPAARPSTQP